MDVSLGGAGATLSGAGATTFPARPSAASGGCASVASKVSAMQVLEAMKTSPVAALARFQIQATTGR
ncbi:MAG: hypothetical protein ACXW3V_01760 [Methylocystis sp.]